MSQRTNQEEQIKKNMEDTARSNRGVADYDIYDPCHFLREAVSAIMKCLGFDSIASSSCCKAKDKNKPFKKPICGQDDAQSSSYTTPDGQPTTSDPPSIIMDPPDDPPVEDLARLGRPPPRPGIGTGRDPQTN